MSRPTPKDASIKTTKTVHPPSWMRLAHKRIQTVARIRCLCISHAMQHLSCHVRGHWNAGHVEDVAVFVFLTLHFTVC